MYTLFFLHYLVENDEKSKIIRIFAEAMKTLTVYKASAGSGKTFTLAVEYIRLLIENPESFRGILAVTFTNKATEEMKMRILSQLYGIANNFPSSQVYVKALKERLGSNYTDRLIAERAGKSLHLLLHNYHFFRVQTIDTFFQSVLRNLARELQLNANLRVELNTKQVVEQAIDNLIDSIADDGKLRNVVMGYIHERMAGGESWNFIRGIKDFGGNIFKDFYKEHRKRLNEVAQDPNFFNKYKSKMNAIMESLDTKYREIGEEAMRIVEEHELSFTDFSYGATGALGYFIKMANGKFSEIDMTKGRMKQGLDDPETWVAKKTENREDIIAFVMSTLHPLMRRTESQRKIDVRQYMSAKRTMEHINNVWLLRYVESFAKDLNDAEQRFMLSDTPTLLSEMVKDEDSPFIFEKIGAHLEHIMIDEFQDTSIVQWRNFKSLLRECMDNGHSNLLVGDVKQSIYRWRSGDWRLLNGDIEKDFQNGAIDYRPLSKNFRSEPNVIHFNNIFLRATADIEVGAIAEETLPLAEQLRKAYSDVEQMLPSNSPLQGEDSGGFVHIELIGKETERSMEERTLDIINTLKNSPSGENQERHIAILVRGNKEAIAMATFLKSQGINVVSAEAFRLDASKAVRKIIEEMENRRTQLTSMSLHDLAEEIVRENMEGEDSKVWREEGAYITTFFDRLSDFTRNTSTVLEDFLRAWEDDICSKTIETPDTDGIRIMTIHKSKGLEFKHVILPYCNWRLEQRQVIWCEPQDAPFNELPIVPLNYSSVNAFRDTIYYDDIQKEHVQNMVDNLNLLYVAMTRACQSLFVIGERGEKTNSRRSFTIEQAIRQLPPEIEGLPVHISIPEDETEDIEVNYGNLNPNKPSSLIPHPSSINPFSPTITPLTIPVTSLESEAIFRQSNKSRVFAEDCINETDRQRYIRMGTVMHQIFSEIRTLDDVQSVLQRMEFDGTLYDEDVTRESLIAELKERFQNQQIRDWFSERWTLYNECAILTIDGEQRPDRVMTNGTETIVIDFKFGKPLAEHREQVSRYMCLLKDMGMPNIKGYLWYVTLNKVEELKD